MRILFFTPFGGRTGSEMMLWHLLRSIDTNDIQAQLFCRRKGELLNEFPSAIKTHVSPDFSLLNRSSNLIRKMLNMNSLEDAEIRKINKQFQPDLWYINTLMLPEVAILASKLNVPYVIHLHELDSQYSFIGKEQLKYSIQNCALAVGCSQKVSNNLKVMGAPKVVTQYECVDLGDVKTNTSKEKIKQELNIPDSNFVWVMSGQPIHRKGLDLFIELAINTKHKNYSFIWLGAPKKSGYEFFIEEKIKYHKLNNVHLIYPSNDKYYDYLNLADIFLLTSREDPFPLVLIESMALGKPLLGFNSGGIAELIDHEQVGVLVDSWNISDMLKAMSATEEMAKKNAFSVERIKERASQFNTSIQVVKWKEVIRQVLDNNGKS